jgi:DNA-binding Xre family transcriptional regulator
MGDYKKISIFLNDDLYHEIEKLLKYRDAKYEFSGVDKKSRSIEEFVTGSVVEVLKKVKRQETIAGLDDLGKPHRLKNRFKEIMEKKGIRNKDLAEMTNIHAGNISIITSNRSQASLDYFLRIWIALGQPPLNECLYRTDEEDSELDE